jgi:Insertion element 4 transposase N-terminal/Transposase DDE domain
MFRIGKEAVALSRAQRLGALHRIIPRQKVKRVLAMTGHDRVFCARLPALFMVYFVLAMGLFCTDCYRQVFRWLRPWKKGSVPGRSSLCEARRRLGVRPLVELAKTTIRLLAGPQTKRAFYRGLRLMALDGFVVDIPDMPVNDEVFGRPPGSRAPGAFPQARVVALCEAGTHVMWRWLIKPIRTAEQAMADRLLRFLDAGMLLMWDQNFLSYSRVKRVIDQGAQLLARVQKDLIFQPIRRFPDGSYLAKLYRNATDRKHGRDGLLVRIIDYTFDDPHRVGHGQKHRLLTTLLDAKLDPAKTLIELYHVRWEQELAIDEFKTHQMQRPVLRSQTPAGVVQELYALLLDHYVVRVLMFEAAQAAQVPPLSISFTGTLKILRCRIPQCPRRQAARRRWWRNLVQEVAEEILPPRRNRINPRVIKRKMSKWKKKRPEHRPYPQPVRPFIDSIVMIR